MIADDADVSVIAAHAARMGIDLLIPREPSAYPDSVYMIGLSKREYSIVHLRRTLSMSVVLHPRHHKQPQIRMKQRRSCARITQLLTEHKDEDSAGTADSQTPTA